MVSRNMLLENASAALDAPELSTLHQVVRDNLETLYAAVEAGFASAPLPDFVRREVEGFLDCGLLCRGFALLECEDCPERRLVAFSCKGRAYAERWNMRSNAKREARGGDRARQQLRIFL